MRLIGLNPRVPGFANLRDVERYFESPDSGFRSEGTKGVFPVPECRIGPDALRPGETLLFSHKGTVVYRVEATTGLLPWQGGENTEYPYSFEVDLQSMRRVSFSVHALETALGLPKPLHEGNGWPRLPDGKAAEEVVERLCEDSKTKWVEERFGVMKNVPKEDFDEFVRLGREAREAIR